jgi:hypothetical protein
MRDAMWRRWGIDVSVLDLELTLGDLIADLDYHGGDRPVGSPPDRTIDRNSDIETVPRAA